ncbi:MAG: cyclic nucleotide-binding domain-containing protein [Ignavibacteriales bacterium]|nr:cyclic nucleotide-binding domain-containing protein [Ignavibacteriales bacterium]
MSSNKTIELIKSNDLFKGLDFTTLNIPFDAKNFLEFKEGDIIYSSGQPSDFVYLIINGEIKIKLNSLKRLFFKSPNEFFGETEVLQNEQRSSSALANSDCLIYKIDANLFSKLQTESASFNGNLLSDKKNEVINTPVLKTTPEPIPSEPIIPKIEPELKSEPVQVEINNLVDVKPKYQTSIDLDKIKIKHYEQEPDLDAFIQKKYLESDNKSLKKNLIGDPDDLTNWIITEGTLEEVGVNKSQSSVTSKSKTNEKGLSFSNPTQNFENQFGLESDGYKSPSPPQPSADINKICKEILDYLLLKTDSHIGAIYLFSQDSQMLEEIYQTNESIYKVKRSIKDGITGLAAKEKEVRFAVSFLNDINYNQDVDRPNDFTGESLIVIPFVDDKKNILGIAQIGSNETMFTKEEERKIKEYAVLTSKVLQQSLYLGSQSNVGSKSELGQSANFIMQDVKAPLLTIKHYSSLLSRFDLPEEVKKVIGLLSAQANSVIDLVQSSIDFTEKNKKIKLEVVNFNEVMDHNLTLLSDYVESRNVKLFKKLAEDVRVKIDKRKFYVACYYVSRFACDMMKSGGNLYFSSQIENSNIVLSIKDGNKIAPNDLEKVFDPGFTGSTNENLGLSLAISKFIIESMNGSIKLESSDTGTTYLVSIPILF